MSAARRRSADATPIGPSRPVPTQLCSHSWIASTVWPGAWPAVEPRSNCGGWMCAGATAGGIARDDAAIRLDWLGCGRSAGGQVCGNRRLPQ